MSSHRDNHPLESALSACSGAALTTVFVTPLDVVKVRMQNPAQQASVAACEHTSCAGSSSTSVMLRVARHEGVASLWAGLQPGLVMSVPGTVLYFAAYEAARDFLRDRASQPTERMQIIERVLELADDAAFHPIVINFERHAAIGGRASALCFGEALQGHARLAALAIASPPAERAALAVDA